MTSKSDSTVTHFLQQGYAYSNKTVLPNSATLYGPYIQTHESMGTLPMQATIYKYICKNMDILEERVGQVDKEQTILKVLKEAEGVVTGGESCLSS